MAFLHIANRLEQTALCGELVVFDSKITQCGNLKLKLPNTAHSKVTTTTRDLLEFLKGSLVTSGVGRHNRFTTSS